VQDIPAKEIMMKRIIWQFLVLGLMLGGWSTVQAATTDTNETYTTTTSSSTDTMHKDKKHHRRAEGTNRSSRPGTSTGVHAVGGNDTPAPMGVPQSSNTVNN